MRCAEDIKDGKKIMKAIIVNNDKSLSYSDVADPVVKEDEILIKTYNAALNRADLMQREGDYPSPPGCPEWMGLEVSGVVEKMGDAAKEKSDLKVGDKVCALLGGGGYAEYAAVRYDMAIKIPKNCTMAEAAAIPEAFATAYLNLFIEGGAKSGETLLMHAGASGLASVVIPMAKAFRLYVITTVSSSKKAQRIKNLGADIIIDTSKEKTVDVLKKLYENGRGIDIAIDCRGGSEIGESLPYMNYRGRWIMIAALAGVISEVDLKNIYVKNIRIIGSTLRSRSEDMKAYILSELYKNVFGKIENGEIMPSIYKVLPIEQADAAQQILKNGENIGKVVLEVRK